MSKKKVRFRNFWKLHVRTLTNIQICHEFKMSKHDLDTLISSKNLITGVDNEMPNFDINIILHELIEKRRLNVSMDREVQLEKHKNIRKSKSSQFIPLTKVKAPSSLGLHSSLQVRIKK